MQTNEKVTRTGLDSHRKFSKVTARGAEGKVVWRQRFPTGVTRNQYRECQRAVRSQPVVSASTGCVIAADNAAGSAIVQQVSR